MLFPIFRFRPFDKEINLCAQTGLSNCTVISFEYTYDDTFPIASPKFEWVLANRSTKYASCDRVDSTLNRTLFFCELQY